jgi:hypothetical protein
MFKSGGESTGRKEKAWGKADEGQKEGTEA